MTQKTICSPMNLEKLKDLDSCIKEMNLNCDLTWRGRK